MEEICSSPPCLFPAFPLLIQHPTNLYDKFIELKPPQGKDSTRVNNRRASSSSTTSSAVSVYFPPVRSSSKERFIAPYQRKRCKNAKTRQNLALVNQTNEPTDREPTELNYAERFIALFLLLDCTQERPHGAGPGQVNYFGSKYLFILHCLCCCRCAGQLLLCSVSRMLPGQSNRITECVCVCMCVPGCHRPFSTPSTAHSLPI